MGENGSFDFAALYELRYACPRQAYSFEIRCAAHHAQDDRGMGMADSFFCHSERRAKPGVEESVSPYCGMEFAGGSRPSPTGWCVGEGFNPPVPGVKTALGGGRAIDKPLRCER